MATDRPGELELSVLLALAGLGREATGRQVWEAMMAATTRQPALPAVHITLNRLSEKGWATCSTSAPEAGRGGKPRRHYGLAPEGARVLARRKADLDRLWVDASRHPLLDAQR